MLESFIKSRRESDDEDEDIAFMGTSLYLLFVIPERLS
jgi:hypothetical protein